MSKTLVIVESPTKAKTISRFLGSSFIVESSFGHVRDLPSSKMGVDTTDGNFTPTYEVSEEKKSHVDKLKKLAKSVDNNIIFATDEDREGEAISWHLAEIFGINPEKAQRIVFHEITKHAIDEALAHPRHITMPIVDAQQARRILDRLVGYELSPLLWKKVARGLSAGRVQSVAVRLVVEREREREAFVAQDYFTVHGLFAKDTTKTDDIFPAELVAINGEKLDKFAIPTEDEATDIVKALTDATYVIEKIEKKEAKRLPPPPFTTSTLQQQSNQKLGYSAKQTMRLAQQLYEGINLGSEGHVGLITYMRTDSISLSEKFRTEAKAHILEMYGAQYFETHSYKNNSKGAQEAHEAVRPTDPNRTPESVKPYLDPQQHKLYTLIYKRTLATQMATAKVAKTTIDISTKLQAAYTFRATGQMIAFPGWLILYPELQKEEALPVLAEKDVLHCSEIKHEKHTTEPPARYNDATLVKIMEEYGIGRPSTYAPTIATIEDRGYVERDEDKRLAPLPIAGTVTDLLVEHFPTIVDYQFTAQMEEDLDSIAEGKNKWQPIIHAFYTPFHETIVEKTEDLKKTDVVSARIIGIDPKTGKEISTRVGRFGPFVQLGTKDDEEKPRFASIPKTIPMTSITLEQALQLLSLPRVLGTTGDGFDIIVDKGRFGPYIKIDATYYNLKEKNPYTLTLEEANDVITAIKEQKAKELIKTFDGTEVKIKSGRYGIYVTDGENNATVPKDMEPASLTLEECLALIEEAKKKPKRGWGKKKTTKIASPKPKKEKKPTTKKAKKKK
jgi:DNA topoisomerase I